MNALLSSPITLLVGYLLLTLLVAVIIETEMR